MDIGKRDEKGNLPSHAWLGGYEIHYYATDGGVLCHQCTNTDRCREADDDPDDTQYHLIGGGVHWEGEPIPCEDCGRNIVSEYGPVEV